MNQHYASSDSNSRTSSPQLSRSGRHRSQLSLSQSVQPPNARMSPASRYHSNLKVLRRRDPSIISIFDQFSHVCVYHHNGKKWEKQGFEGSMFLYERASYPPYGFYILNRVGMDDYIQRLYPEDDITAHGGYLMLRSYPNFTASRLNTIHNDFAAVSDKFSRVYAFNSDGCPASAKGESQTIGLWTFSTDGREPLNDVMLRLHSYIKENLPYPEDYRYGPDRPPPPNPYLHTGGAAPNEDSDSSDARASQSDRPNGLTELDKLFAKILPTNKMVASSMTSQTPSTSHGSTSTPSLSIHSLTAPLGGGELAQQAHSQGPLPFHQSSQQPPPSTGITLLDSIFASASNHTSTVSPQVPDYQKPHFQFPAPQQNSIPIHSPAPKSSTLPPQVLSQNVIGSLLGLPTSRAPSAASTGYRASPSHPSSRDGDNEDESHGSSSDGSTGQPLHADPAFRTLNVPTNGHGPSINGDATPRPSFTDGPQDLSNNNHASSLKPPRNGRPLVPFESSSALWPYPRQQRLDDSTADGKEQLGEEEGEIIELDFSDMSALSDPDAFLRAQRSKKENGVVASTVSVNGVKKEKEKAKKSRRKNKKEKLEAIAKEKAKIEQSWDFPDAAATASMVQVQAPVHFTFNDDSPPASPSPQPSPELLPRRVVSMPGVTTTSNVVQRSQTPTRPQNGKKGLMKDAPAGNGVQPDRALESLLASLNNKTSVQSPSTYEKDAFVRELLALIQTDSDFVDTLWRQYHARST